ncbi:Sec-independent protein translocase protein TatB [Phenylobacterium sp.]|uniref:Sec-independent protein translocase protein TatB n=1 Tax=Phenylobacterium sp. TaxID=1871053 RepID=UPI0025ED7A62|nr:Sec-independent protein translocase protein TatB [Phenylobacterium sp.]
MLPEVGGLEWLVIAVVALIVIGPKDLPVMMRRVGQFVAKLRGMANEFRSSFDEMARQSELDDLRKEVEAMRRGQFGDTDLSHEMRSTVSDIESSMSDVGVQLHPPMSYQYEPPVEPPPPVEISEAPASAKKPARKPAAKAANATPSAKKPASRKTAAKAKPATDEIVQAAKPRKRSSKIVEGGA